jgi:hypothetical protein
MRWALSLSRALSLSHSSFCLATKDGFSPFAKGESTLLVLEYYLELTVNGLRVGGSCYEFLALNPNP